MGILREGFVISVVHKINIDFIKQNTSEGW